MSLELAQEGSAWHAWRALGVCASDLPIIMGLVDWSTPMQVAQEKWGTAEPRKENPAMTHGKNTEPEARAKYELFNNIDMKPALVVHPEHSWIRASLDGLNKEARKSLEIKVPGKADHGLARQGTIPEKYIWQCTWQMLAADTDVTDYYSYYKPFRGTPAFPVGDAVLLKLERCAKREKKAFEIAEKFWEKVLAKMPMESEADYRTITDKATMLLCEKYKEIHSQADKLELELKALKEQIIKIANGERVICNGVAVSPSVRKGLVDYSKVPQLVGVDLEPFRKPSSTSMVVTVKK